MNRLLERATGAQILPNVGDERAHISAWAASQACSADQRAKFPEWAALAVHLEVAA